MDTGGSSLWSLKPPLHNSSSPRDKEPIEVQKIRKWQEERVAKKLRGDYEHAVIHLSDLLTDNLHTSIGIASIRVLNAQKTRRSFLEWLINPLKPSPTTQQDLESTLHTVRRVSDVLDRTDIFKAVSVSVERSRDELAHLQDVDLVFRTIEKGKYAVKTSTEVGKGEVDASVNASINNVFGGAEKLSLNMAYGTTTKKTFEGSFSAPITPDLNTWADLSAYGLLRDHSSFANCSEVARGIKASIRHGAPFNGSHMLTYEAVLRDIGNLSPSASMSIRQSAGQTTKSSISYTFFRDTRDDNLLGTRGYLTKVSQELAGLGGDASFYKIETENHLSRSLSPGVTLSLSACSGLLWSFSQPSLFPDRFQLGGPTSLRSFRVNGLGPKDGPDSLGGDLYWATGIRLISNIPSKPDWPIKTHAFLNAGRLDPIDHSRSLVDNIKNTITKPSISAGVGLIYKFDPVRVELNFGVPLVTSQSDGTRKGVQVGLGLEFL
ncbi:hypothetical protein K435DRAFT_745075 [Dendrothele bispora CBS 962.96]|uniref:Bacterial surface antigen (D15) domain-containing protein n=1 Tax=Dendrothele bispora (strain CBS 962.96) TaxID=1314807 RepID=A0A4S8MRD6_DENBC|nr:hypothetical protein K435DRAFT_745075 [Dendrothele bispora CBS 962.96]